uniref:Uncharacterized protein n=1 Tax=Moniliophthora roreri TaxID=221103 RepID=A0A0W0FEB0_MONRR
MKGSPAFQQEVNTYHVRLRTIIRDLADDIAGPLPRTYLNQHGCCIKAYVNYGESDFDNIGRIYSKCTTQSHLHHPIVYATDNLDAEAMKGFHHLWALYELSGWKYSSSLEQCSTERQHLDVLTAFIKQAVALSQEHAHQSPSSAPTTLPASLSTSSTSPVFTMSPVLGKRKWGSSDGKRKAKRMALQPFPCPSPLEIPQHMFHDVSNGEFFI